MGDPCVPYLMEERPPVPRCSNVTGRDELSRVKSCGGVGPGSAKRVGRTDVGLKHTHQSVGRGCDRNR